MRIEEFIANDKIFFMLSFLKLGSVIIIVAHFLACYYWFIGQLELENGEICWIWAAGIEDAPVDVQYVSSLYWAFTTMTTVGYGDIAPITANERLFNIVSIIIACGVFAYTVGSIGETVSR